MAKLLLVDDDIAFVNLLAKHIGRQNFPIEAIGLAHDGLEAMRVCEDLHPEIILTDVRMPNMNGIELAIKLREKYPDVVILFMSVYSEKSYLKMAIKLQAIDYIDKPVDPEELNQALQRSFDMIEQGNAILASGKKPYNKSVEAIIQYIMDHYTEEITIDYLASHVYLTPNYLSNLFKKETSKTIIQFITEYRIGKSKNLLVNSNLNLSEIARAVGYSDPRYFSKLFQKLAGTKPSAFRREKR
jgi:two-component system response regulator YesN